MSGWLEELQAELETVKKLEGVQQMLGLYLLYKKFLALRGQGTGSCMPQSAADDLAKAVPDDLVKAIVSDQRRGVSAPGWLPPDPASPVIKGSGWVDPLPLGLPPGVKWCDQQLDVADALDKRDLERRLGVDRARKGE
jgi:hypothetical protein